jgi:HEAT repeat protein
MIFRKISWDGRHKFAGAGAFVGGMHLGRRSEIERLLNDLTYEDLHEGEDGVVDWGAGRRVEALAALAELGNPETIEPVRDCLDDPEPNVRQAAVRTLAVLDPEARDYLIQAVIGWPTPPFGDARLEALRLLQESDDEHVAERVVQAVAYSNGSTVLDGITRESVVRLATSGDNGTKPAEIVALTMDLLREPEGNRRNLEIVLAWLGEHSVDDLVDALEDPQLAESAATVLGALKDSRAVPGLVMCLDDERPDVRLAAAWALGEIRDVRAIEGLMRAVSDVDYEVRRQAQEALDALGTVGVVAGVSAVLQIVMDKGPEQLPKPAED